MGLSLVHFSALNWVGVVRMANSHLAAHTSASVRGGGAEKGLPWSPGCITAHSRYQQTVELVHFLFAIIEHLTKTT